MKLNTHENWLMVMGWGVLILVFGAALSWTFLLALGFFLMIAGGFMSRYLAARYSPPQRRRPRL